MSQVLSITDLAKVRNSLITSVRFRDLQYLTQSKILFVATLEMAEPIIFFVIIVVYIVIRLKIILLERNELM